MIVAAARAHQPELGGKLRQPRPLCSILIRVRDLDAGQPGRR